MTGKRLMVDVAFALVPEWLLDAEVSAQAVRLYAVLSCYADTAGTSFPSRKTLAERLRVRSKDTVDRALKELVDAGAVTVRGRLADDGDQTSNEYTVHRVNPTQGVAAKIGPPRRKGAATGSTGRAHGGRKDAPTVAAQIVHELDPLELDPLEENLHVDAKAPTTINDDASSTPEPTPPAPPREDVERLCTHLADRVEANGSKRPTITKAWRDAARLLLDRDGRTEDQVTKAIDWCQDDEFWRSNILAMPTLRKQYDRLRLAAQRQQQQPRRSNDIDWDQAMERAAHLDNLTHQPAAIGAPQ